MQIINDFCNMEVLEPMDLDIQDIIDDENSFENILDVCRSLVLIDVDAEANNDGTKINHDLHEANQRGYLSLAVEW